MGAFQFQYDYYERMDDLAVGDLIVVPSDVFKDNVSNGKFKASEKRLELSKFLQHCRPILRMGSHQLSRFLNVSIQAPQPARQTLPPHTKFEVSHEVTNSERTISVMVSASAGRQHVVINTAELMECSRDIEPVAKRGTYTLSAPIEFYTSPQSRTSNGSIPAQVQLSIPRNVDQSDPDSIMLNGRVSVVGYQPRLRNGTVGRCYVHADQMRANSTYVGSVAQESNPPPPAPRMPTTPGSTRRSHNRASGPTPTEAVHYCAEYRRHPDNTSPSSAPDETRCSLCSEEITEGQKMYRMNCNTPGCKPTFHMSCAVEMLDNWKHECCICHKKLQKKYNPVDLMAYLKASFCDDTEKYKVQSRKHLFVKYLVAAHEVLAKKLAGPDGPKISEESVTDDIASLLEAAVLSKSGLNRGGTRYPDRSVEPSMAGAVPMNRYFAANRSAKAWAEKIIADARRTRFVAVVQASCKTDGEEAGPKIIKRFYAFDQHRFKHSDKTVFHPDSGEHLVGIGGWQIEFYGPFDAFETSTHWSLRANPNQHSQAFSFNDKSGAISGKVFGFINLKTKAIFNLKFEALESSTSVSTRGAQSASHV
eukprot:950059_1